MGWFILKHIFATIFSFINIRRLPDQEKDLEILVLRQQLSILQRKLNHPIKPRIVQKPQPTENRAKKVANRPLLIPRMVFENGELREFN